jgi:uncharacterized protein (TIGR04222 family)
MNLNPFDLRGPEFLVFYLVLSAGTLVLVWMFRRWKESGEEDTAASAARKVAQDPYQVAYLRGGRDEVVRIAVVSLLERGRLEADGENLHTTDPEAAAKARRALDKAILTKFADQGKAQSLYSDDVALGEAEVIAEPLKVGKLLPDEDVTAARVGLAIAATAFLWLVAGVKIAVALARGRTNILFLVLLAVIVPFAVYAVVRRFRTALGDEVYSRLQAAFSRLGDRGPSLRVDQTTSELTYLAALFGVTALPAAMLGIVEPLQLHPPRPVASGWSGSGSSCSSGSSCGGSSCGGGGCGGGCGGCG